MSNQRASTLRRLAIALILLASTGGSVASARTFTVAPLQHEGDDDPAYGNAQEALLAALGRHATKPVTLAKPAKKPCAVDNDKCLAAAAKAAKVDAIVAGSFERSPGGYGVLLRRVDAKGKGRGEFSQLVAGGSPDLVALMELAACQLEGKADCTAPLSIEGPSDVRLTVDGNDKGPLPQALALPLGRHALRAVRGSLATPDRYLSLVWNAPAKLYVDARADALSFTDQPPPPPVDPTLPPLDDGDLLALPALDLPPPPPDAAVAPVGPPAPAPPAPEPPPAAPPEPVATVVPEAVPAPVAEPAPAPDPALAIPGGDPVRGTALVPVEPPPPPERPRSAAWIPAATVGTAIGGGVGLLGGAVFGIIAGAQAADVNGKFAAGTLRPTDAATYDSARANAVAANVLYGLGALSLATSAVLFAVDPGATLLFIGGGGDGSTPGVTLVGSFE